MKTSTSALVLLSLVLLTPALGHARVVTITATARNGTNEVAEISIGPYEVAELVSYVSTSSQLIIFKDGGTNFFGLDAITSTPLLTIAGPATFRLNAVPDPRQVYYTSFATFRILPEAFPPDRTLMALPGTNQTSITLECSTNLVDWTATTNGIYGPMPEAKFFRIKLERK